MMNETIKHKIKSAKKACLILQGGGMRGSYTAGAIRVFAENNLLENFKFVVGESAGALNGATFISGQTDYNDLGEIFVEYMASKEFIDKTRLSNIIDLDFIVRTMESGKRIDIDKVRASSTQLHVCVTDEETLEPIVFTSRSPHLMQALHAAVTVPIVYSGKTTIEGRNYIDGVISHCIPYEYALGLDADLYVAILTNPLRHRYQDSRIKEAVLRSKFASSKHSKQLLEQIDKMDDLHNKTLNKIELDSHHYQNVEALFPSDASRLAGMLEIDKEKVKDCQRLGHEDAIEFLARPQEQKTHGNVHAKSLDIKVFS